MTLICPSTIFAGGLPNALADNAGNIPAWFAPTAAAIAVALGLGVIGWQVWLARRNRSRHPAATPPSRLPQRREVDEFTRDAAEVVNRLASVLDAKAERIERLLEDANRKLAELERAAGSISRREDFADATRRAMRPQTASRSEESPTTDSAMQDRILHLSGRGLGPVDIAKQLHQPIGQVELVIALHRGAVRL